MGNTGKDEFIIARYRRNAIKVEIGKIMYVTNAKRGSRIYVEPSNEEVEYEEPILIDIKLAEFHEKYGEFKFEFASARHIVNMNYIRVLSPKSIRLDNGTLLTVSRPYYKNIREKFLAMGI